MPIPIGDAPTARRGGESNGMAMSQCPFPLISRATADVDSAFVSLDGGRVRTDGRRQATGPCRPMLAGDRLAVSQPRGVSWGTAQRSPVPTQQRG
jgi:hypothetical protein